MYICIYACIKEYTYFCFEYIVGFVEGEVFFWYRKPRLHFRLSAALERNLENISYFEQRQQSASHIRMAHTWKYADNETHGDDRHSPQWAKVQVWERVPIISQERPEKKWILFCTSQ